MPNAYPVNKEGLGADCISCCPIEVSCDCSLFECVIQFSTYAMNLNASDHFGHTSTEVDSALDCLLGLALKGTYEKPIVNGAGQADYGRSYIHGLIAKWDVNASNLQSKYQEVFRVLHPYVECYLADKCACDEANELRAECNALACLMYTIESFFMGFDNFEEWRDGGLCGVCYKDCNGNDIVYSK